MIFIMCGMSGVDHLHKDDAKCLDSDPADDFIVINIGDL